MPVLRTDIEKGLEEIIAHEEGKRFQALAVVLAKQKYPDLIASEYHKDLGLDAYAAPSVASDRVGRGVASSITATLAKITADARRAKENFPELKTLIFFTPRSVTNQTKVEWAEGVRKEFGYELLVISREDLITSLMLPENISLCRTSLRIAVAIESGDQVALEHLREAVAEEVANWRTYITSSSARRILFPESWSGMSITGAFADAPPAIAKRPRQPPTRVRLSLNASV
jgi:hypothetical protein